MIEVDPGKVLVERHEHVLVLTINRPEQRNAIDHDVSFLIGRAIEQADADPDVRVIVLASNGPSFCAGVDLKALARGDRLLPDGMEHYHLAGFVRHFTSRPTIAAVQGPALGGGTELALACDLVVAEESATFGLPEVKRGLIAAAGGVFRLAAAVPQKVALEMLFTGSSLTAADAHRWGLVNRVVPDSQARTAALELAAEIARNAPLAVQASKRLALRVVDGEPGGEAAMWAASNDETARIFRSEDGREGPRAFAEKRPPVWTGR